ncbi:MAG: glycosyl transferase family 36 [Gemmataceae bacterium]|nr:glycosyl transferase family 36 [Gemmataceae bacterium]MDW8264156.1 glucoamylase family protein [Gemmataceae bacterium]
MSTTLVDPEARARVEDGLEGGLFHVPLEGPIRAELFGLEHLEAHARELARHARRRVELVPGESLRRRLLAAARDLERTRRRIVEAAARQEPIATDAEWLLDNFHVIKDNLREVRQDLPRGYYRLLPKLGAGPFAGLPCVYALALELIAHTDSCLDETNITRFVRAYQEVRPLTIGEIWAVPIMLRLGLLENLQRLARHMEQAQAHRAQAERWKDHLLACKGISPEDVDRRLQMRRLRCPWSDNFVVCLLQLLRDQGPEARVGMEWLEHHLSRRNDTPAEVVRRAHQQQAANQVSVGNCVTSLRLLSALDWTVFFERTSLVELELRRDPAGVYPRQDFATRDRCRRVVEQLARGSGHDELAVARRAVELARHQVEPVDGGRLHRSAHCGYYLLDEGRLRLEADLGYRAPWAERVRRWLRGNPEVFYFGSIGTTWLALVLLAALGAGPVGWRRLWVALAVLVPASELAVGLVHYLITKLLPPRVLPKLDFREGIPADCATFVVMPTMLVRPESGASLAARLEIHYLSNPDPQLHFALLTDFADAPAEQMPTDEPYLQAARDAIRALNEKYAAGGPDRFFLFHRRRQWNPVMGCWMGWERKRGKLCEFNRLLRGDRSTSFSYISCRLEDIPIVRFVITLDADTKLPREAASALIGTLAHPLNRPRFDPVQGRVVEGYAVLQPRVSPLVVGTDSSLFARIFTGSAGIDPYTTAVSDVYQDLFGRGSFTGKGIYDVDAFEAAVGQTFPENHILSHDLIEGNYARCGLVTDIELLDEFPRKYLAYSRREHRWVRGDWQILPWLFGTVPSPTGPRVNPLPLLERWKIFDNLRRSLVPPSLVLLLLLAWTLLPGSPWFWTLAALAVPALPLILVTISGLARLVRGGGSWRLAWRSFRRDVAATAAQTALSVTFLAEQARSLLDAIGRTLLRLYVTRRNLLEWETAFVTERRLNHDLTSVVGQMAWAPAAAVAAAGAHVASRPDAHPAAAPVLVAWFVAPLVAWGVGLPRPPREAPLDAVQRRSLRRIARKTWAFFETFVTADDHWLPPDNYQEDPKGALAHRTSPTNIGLYLLSALAAHDLGYLSLSALVDRLEKTFDTLDELDRHQGHIYNWYDTRTLAPLHPRYISTVDSGNLLGCLLTLKQGLREKIEEPIAGPAVRDGLADTFQLLAEAVQALESPTESQPLPSLDAMRALVHQLRDELEVTPGSLGEWKAWLGRLATSASELASRGEELKRLLADEPKELLRWSRALLAQIRDRQDELERVAPWLSGPAGGTAADRSWLKGLSDPPSVAEIHAHLESLAAEGSGDLPQLGSQAGELLARCQSLADRAGAWAAGMNFRLLYNQQRHLFSIGWNLDAGRLDSAHYDLLASESCLTSFLAIARGEVPRKHWFQLGRPMTRAAGGTVLLSWGGTMFEYLMPRLLLRAYPGTLLEDSWRTAVDRQIEYGRQNRVPWGISESGFNALDAHLDYQYQSFGVPGLGLKRGLGKDLVIAPYATALALAVRPRAAVANFAALAAAKGEGPFGFYEAIDHTRDRLSEKRRPAVVRSYMAHHQGMTLVALVNCLLGEPMPRRLHAEPMVRATELLLQEKLPAAAPLVQAHGDEVALAPIVREALLPMSRRLTTPQTQHPRVHLLSNRQYSVLITNAGGGYSTWRDLDVTRWREDATRDSWGQFCFVRDLRSGLTWSAGHQPVCRPADEYEVVYSTDKAEFRRLDGGIETHWEITVSPENSAEVRRLTLTNHNPRPHDLEVTSYAEISLCPRRADQAHAAFAKLFLETEYLARESALLCRRRPRAEDQKPVWAVHVLAVDGPTLGAVQYETDRARFLGRGRSAARPAALEPGAVLSGTTGAVLDPIFSLRRRVRVQPGTSVSIAFTTAVAESREEALALADQYHDFHGVNRAFELAWAHSQVELQHLHLSAEEAHLFQRLAAHVIFTGPTLRRGEAVAANRQGQSGLWRHGISGDLPIVLVRVAEADDVPLVRQLLLAHSYWRLKGLAVDLVILNDHPATYQEELHAQLLGLALTSEARDLLDKPGGVFLRRGSQMSDDDRLLLQAAARVVLSASAGSLAGQVDRQEAPPPLPHRLKPTARRSEVTAVEGSFLPSPPLMFDNGTGGFTTDGAEYVIRIRPSSRRGRGETRFPTPALPPAPWINVVANPACGFLISEAGSGFTWAGNSQSNRLTSWSNDPVSDPPSEVVYLRDEVTGDFWTPTPLPRGGDGETVVRHGPGWTRFHHESHGLGQELLLLVPPEDPIKLIALKVRNLGRTMRRLSATFYVEWVLGTTRDQAPMQVVCSLDPESGALVARNPWSVDFAGRLAFADVALRPRSVTADRTEFLGRNGSPTAPAALYRLELSGRVGPLRDPCAALMVKWELPAGEEKEILFLLGEAAGPEDLQRLLRRYRQPGRVDRTFDQVRRWWDGVLKTIQVKTPDPAFDLLVNQWLLYQVLSCRLWARSAFYQSGGAYGFRDQLQDVMALVHAAPGEARAHLLRAAARQFVEGDVQHWWHPPAGRGVRTRFSDDLLWLPLVTAYYVQTTGDATVLDEQVPFLRAPVLKPGQDEEYGLPEVTEQTASLYEHCVLALERGHRLGEHGLPLMGTGDWNDGMNRVGAGGKGESVWVGWFLVTILNEFALLAERRGDVARAAWCRERADALRQAIETHAWDGGWYRRAYFDDGTPLGSADNDECQIDSLPQTWAVISRVANPERAQQAMAAVEQRLVRSADRLILLFTPPFDRGTLQPGYVKGYVPGIRENGGQYTHAAAWVVWATALLGRGSRAVELFGLLNPIRHAQTPADVNRYRVEPYVVAADVYSQPPHTGRGGWTWYTGSAGWLYRVALESILGFQRRGTTLRLDPCIASHWGGFEITYRHHSASYRIRVENPHGVERGVQSMTLDGQPADPAGMPLADDGRLHEVRVVLGPSPGLES